MWPKREEQKFSKYQILLIHWNLVTERKHTKGWYLMWRPTSPGNEDVLICINAPFMTQRVLKPWWQWTYQNSAVKWAAARAIPGWVTSWEVWYGEPKADNIVSLGVGRYTWCGRFVYKIINNKIITRNSTNPCRIGLCWGCRTSRTV